MLNKLKQTLRSYRNDGTDPRKNDAWRVLLFSLNYASGSAISTMMGKWNYYTQNVLQLGILFASIHLPIRILDAITDPLIANNIMPHGSAIGRGNVYTYRTARYSFSTTICGDADRCGAQDHEWSANLGEDLALFTTHPAGNGNSRFSSSPGYWIGNGRRPMSVQHENVNITVYKIPKKIRLAETGISKITHAYMPVDFYDEFELNGNMVFARKNGIFISMISNGEMKFKPYSRESLNGLYSNMKRELEEEYLPQKEFDLCREGGDYHIYITELSDIDRESFDDFKTRIKSNKAVFSGDSASYKTYFGEISSSYSGEFKINGADALKVFDRYDSKFCKMKRKADSLLVDSGANKLSLKFDSAEREFDY